MGRLDGKVAVISGVARGQGRSHAVTLAREGATIVGFDILEQLETALTPGATEADMEETVRLVEEQDQRCLTAKVDARDLSGLQAFAGKAMGEFGRIDILLVNHGMWTVAKNSWELEEHAWQETIDVMLTGAWKVCKAFIPKILDGDRGGSIVITASANGVTPQPGAVAYCAAKAGEIHMMRVLAWELGPAQGPRQHRQPGRHPDADAARGRHRRTRAGASPALHRQQPQPAAGRVAAPREHLERDSVAGLG